MKVTQANSMILQELPLGVIVTTPCSHISLSALEKRYIVLDKLYRCYILRCLNTNLAEMTLEIIQRRMTGVYHLSGATRINRYNFALRIASAFNLDPALITPAMSSEFAWAAKRPRDSSLNIEKAQKALKNKPLPVDQALLQLRSELLNSNF